MDVKHAPSSSHRKADHYGAVAVTLAGRKDQSESPGARGHWTSRRCEAGQHPGAILLQEDIIIETLAVIFYSHLLLPKKIYILI